MHKYGVNIYWSDEDQVYIAEVADLPGCITHGDTHGIALANANEAVQLWIETAKENSDSIPKPKVRKSVSQSTEFRSKGQTQSERLHRKRRNNPKTHFNMERQRLRMNPKAH